MHIREKAFVFPEEHRKDKRQVLVVKYRSKHDSRCLTASFDARQTAGRYGLFSSLRDDGTTLVVTAFRAHSVRKSCGAALGAFHKTGKVHFPVGAAALIASCLGSLSFRFGHLLHLLTGLIIGWTGLKQIPELFKLGIDARRAATGLTV